LIRVAVVAPGMALRIGLREVLRNLPNVDVVAEATSPHGLPPVDVLVLVSADDLSELDDGAPPVLLLSDDPDEVTHLPRWHRASGIALGRHEADRLTGFPVWGILPREASSEELSAAVHALAEGLWVGSPTLAQNLLGRRPVPALDGAEEVINPLTDRERQVLQLTAEGLANKQIAAALDISENTVKFHLSSLYAKLGVTSRTEAVRAGARRGWVVL
jgi:DNA-binding CsgD family transcriptional regulator